MSKDSYSCILTPDEEITDVCRLIPDIFDHQGGSVHCQSSTKVYGRKRNGTRDNPLKGCSLTFSVLLGFGGISVIS